MKDRHFFYRFCVLSLLLGWPVACAVALDAGVAYAVYATPERPYVEVNIEIASGSVTFRPVDSVHLQASVEVLILIRRGEEVVNYEKYRLNSPLVTIPRDLLDVKRFLVPLGEYALEVDLQDAYDPQNRRTLVYPLQVDVVRDKPYLSAPILLRNYRRDSTEHPFVKHGLFLEPLPFAFYEQRAVRLAFYAEVYYGDRLGPNGYAVRYCLEQELGNGNTTLLAAGAQRKKPSRMDAVLAAIDIGKLRSGNYTLTVELRTEHNELVAQRKVTFQRSNPLLDLDLSKAEIGEEELAKYFVADLSEENLRYSLRALSALTWADDAETLKNLLAGKDLHAMRVFLLRYFAEKNPNDPEAAYLEYMRLAGAIDRQFHSGFRYGFETDRGRTFLRFGRPNDIIRVDDDPAAPPYEIWVYFDFPQTRQRNVKFLFYNPSLAGEDFILLHSNARGEINNPRWEVVLYGRNAINQIEGTNYHDATHMQRNFNRNARRFFEDF
jgi:GWxTD domain-containing protein